MCILEGRGESEQHLNEVQGKDTHREKLNSHRWKWKYFRNLNVYFFFLNFKINTLIKRKNALFLS